jgi:hypothetical protein
MAISNGVRFVVPTASKSNNASVLAKSGACSEPEVTGMIELSRRDSSKWHMRLAVDYVHCLPKTLFLVLFHALYFLHP